MPQSDTILAIQADGTVAGLHTGDAAIDPDTISALEQYAAKVYRKTFSLSIRFWCSITRYLAGKANCDQRIQIIIKRVFRFLEERTPNCHDSASLSWGAPVCSVA